MSLRVLHVLAGSVDAPGVHLPTLAVAWRVLEAAGAEQVLVSPAGGAVDAIDGTETDADADAWRSDVARRALLARTARPQQIDAGDFDAVVLHGPDPALDGALLDPGVARLVASVRAHGGAVARTGGDAGDAARGVVERLRSAG